MRPSQREEKETRVVHPRYNSSEKLREVISSAYAKINNVFFPTDIYLVIGSDQIGEIFILGE